MGGGGTAIPNLVPLKVVQHGHLRISNTNSSHWGIRVRVGLARV